MRHIASALLIGAIILPLSSHAFEVEQPAAPAAIHDEVMVFKIGGATYTVTTLPIVAKKYEAFDTPPPAYAEVTSGLTLGSRITEEEAIKVIEAFYRENAIDFSTIRIRKFQLGALQYVAWCTDVFMFACTERQFRTGNLVEFEVNGGNRSGGMTGFERRIMMIRKV